METLIAEKFHAMVDRDESNSRMKDFFDVYQLFTNHEIDKKLLAEAIFGTFKNRNTPYRENLALFTDKFATFCPGFATAEKSWMTTLSLSL